MSRRRADIRFGELLDGLVEEGAGFGRELVRQLECNSLAAALHSHFVHGDNTLRMIFLDPAGRDFCCGYRRPIGLRTDVKLVLGFSFRFGFLVGGFLAVPV